MRKSYIFFLFILFSVNLFAQEEADSTLNQWVPSLITSLNFSQIAFNNWTQGGENSLAWTLGGNFDASYKTTDWKFKNELKAAYGRTKIQDEDSKVTDNELYMETVFSYDVGWVVSPYASNTILTQIAAGYEYSDTSKTEISNFFDPGYITQSVGFTYNKHPNIQTRLGFAFKETITDKFTQSSDDPETPDEIETFKFETGFESVTDAQFELAENILFKSKLSLFSAFDEIDKWDVRWDNVITAKVNNWLNVNFTYLLIYQEDQIMRTQTKQALQVGITYTIF